MIKMLGSFAYERQHLNYLRSESIHCLKHPLNSLQKFCFDGVIRCKMGFLQILVYHTIILRSNKTIVSRVTC